MVKILDCTTRDGGHETKWNFEDVFVKTLMEFLNKSDVSYYEIGYRNHVDIASLITMQNSVLIALLCEGLFQHHFYLC